MTFNWLKRQTWQFLDEPTDLDPDTDTQYTGNVPLLNWVLNEAQRQVASYKDVHGRITRIRSLMADMFFQAKVVDSTLDAAGTTTTVVFPSADVSADDDRYNGWVVEIGGEQRMIMDYVGSTRTATVHAAFSDAPASGDDYELYKNFAYLTTSSDPWYADHIAVPASTTRYRAIGNLVEPLRIVHVDDKQKVKKTGKQHDFTGTLLSKGVPGLWNVVGNRIYFNRQMNEDDWYQMWYYRMPTAMTNDSDEPELPEMFHWAMVRWAVWWGLERDGESSRAYAAKRNFEDEMTRVIKQVDIAYELENDYGIVDLE